MGAGNDTLVNSGEIRQAIVLGAGDDLLDNRLGTIHDWIQL